MARWIALGLVIVALAGGALWWRMGGRDTSDQRAAAKASVDAGAAPVAPAYAAPPTKLPPAPTQLTAEQEQQETDLLAATSHEIAFTDAESAEVMASLVELQTTRRQLFADHAAGRITVEQVSDGLRAARALMHDRIEAAVGPERAGKVRAKLRESHGFEPAPSPQ